MSSIGRESALSIFRYPLVSETPTVRGIVETLARAIGRGIAYVPITDEQWLDAMKQRINPHALDHLSHLWQYFRQTQERRLPTDAIRAVTGRNPQTLQEFFRSNAKLFDSNSPISPNNWLTYLNPIPQEFTCPRSHL